jgi:hypothetical protein
MGAVAVGWIPAAIVITQLPTLNFGQRLSLVSAGCGLALLGDSLGELWLIRGRLFRTGVAGLLTAIYGAVLFLVVAGSGASHGIMVAASGGKSMLLVFGDWLAVLNSPAVSMGGPLIFVAGLAADAFACRHAALTFGWYAGRFGAGSTAPQLVTHHHPGPAAAPARGSHSSPRVSRIILFWRRDLARVRAWIFEEPLAAAIICGLSLCSAALMAAREAGAAIMSRTGIIFAAAFALTFPMLAASDVLWAPDGPRIWVWLRALSGTAASAVAARMMVLLSLGISWTLCLSIVSVLTVAGRRALPEFLSAALLVIAMSSATGAVAASIAVRIGMPDSVSARLIRHVGVAAGVVVAVSSAASGWRPAATAIIAIAILLPAGLAASWLLSRLEYGAAADRGST